MNEDSPGSPSPSRHPVGGLGGRAMSGGRWAAIGMVVLQISTTLTTLVLARILLPADFGAVAAAMIIVRLFELLTDFGLGLNLVRKAEVGEREVSTIFWLGVSVGSTVAALAILFAPTLSSLIGQPESAALIQALAVTIPLTLIGNVGVALLLRNLRFRAVAASGMISIVAYMATTIGLALVGLGAWAVIIGYLVRNTFQAIVPLVVARWRPRLEFERGFLREELKFSGGIAGQHGLGYLQKNIDYWAISASLGATTLGIYYIAFVIPDLMRQRFGTIGGQVLYPVISKIVSDKERARSAYLRLLRAIAFASIPALLGISVLSDLIVDIAFGDRWEGAAAPMSVLAVAAIFAAIGAYCGPLASAAGRPHLAILPRVVGVLTLAAGLAITIPSADLTAIAWAVVASAAATTVGLYIAVGPMIDLSLVRVLVAIRPVLVPSLIMYVGVLALRQSAVGDLGEFIAAAVLVAVGILLYGLASWTFFRTTFREQLLMMRRLLVPL